jgi:hypothetical protein
VNVRTRGVDTQWYNGITCQALPSRLRNACIGM